MTITPTSAPQAVPPPAGMGRPRVYDWDAVTLGEWQRWLTLGQDIDDQEFVARATRVSMAAVAFARRHGLKVQQRRRTLARTLDLRFTKTEGAQ